MCLKLAFPVVILSLAATETCRKFECKDLDSKVCAVVEDTTIQFNDNPGDWICWLSLYRKTFEAIDDIASGTEFPASCSGDDEEDSDDSST